MNDSERRARNPKMLKRKKYVRRVFSTLVCPTCGHKQGIMIEKLVALYKKSGLSIEAAFGEARKFLAMTD